MKYLLLALLSPLLALAAPQTVDPQHSSVSFKAKHFLVSTIPGRFKEFTGTIDLAPRFEDSKVEFTVDIKSIDTAVPKRDDHLRSADFFDASTHPQATFRSTKIVKKGKEFLMTGDLTIRGTTRSETFAVKQLGKAMDEMLKAERTFFTATGKINRKEYGVNYGINALVTDEIALEIHLETMPSK